MVTPRATKLSERELKYRLLSLLVLVCSANFLAGATCASTTPREAPTCLQDSECGADELCVESTCLQRCASDPECGPAELCRTKIRSSGESVSVCAGEDGPQDGETGCSSDADCVEALDDPQAVCSIDGFCFMPQREFAVLIRDTSVEEPASGAPDGGSGSDIGAVFLIDDGGRPAAYGEAIRASEAATVDALDGTEVALTSDGECPDDAAASEGALGVGGWVLLRFVDPDGAPLSWPEPGWSLVVVEWGPLCPQGELEPVDTYEVWGCSAPSATTLDVETNCTTALSDGPRSGRAELNL